MRRTLVLTGLAVFVLLAAAACGGYGGGGGGSKETTTSSSGGNVNMHGTKDVSGQSSTEMELDDYYFGPTVLKGDPGQKITLDLKNEGSVEHNITIDSQSIDRDLEPGKKGDVEVTIPDSGKLTFYCKYHRSQGMSGTLEAAPNGY